MPERKPRRKDSAELAARVACGMRRSGESVADAAERTGLDRRTIQRAVKLRDTGLQKHLDDDSIGANEAYRLINKDQACLLDRLQKGEVSIKDVAESMKKLIDKEARAGSRVKPG